MPEPIWDIVKILQEELFSAPPHVLGELHSVRWSVMKLPGVRCSNWLGRGLALLIPVSILMGEVPCVEAVLEMEDNGRHVKKITSRIEGVEDPVVTHHLGLNDFIRYVLEARKLAAIDAWRY